MKMAGWLRVTQCENIPLREGRVVKMDGHEIAVFNMGNRFLAVENRCPHRGGPLADGIVSGERVVCPFHSRKVCLRTGQMEGAVERPLCAQTYPTRIVDGYVDLKLSAAMEEATVPQPTNFPLAAMELGLP